MTGVIFGVGVGPGDPELVTVKAVRIIAAADVIAYPGAEHGRSLARDIASPYLRPGQVEVHLRYPVTVGTTGHPGGYEAAMAEFYDACADELAEHLDAGRDVAVLCEGDPFLYGSYMYLHDRLGSRFRSEVVPGVTSFSAAAAAAGRPLVRRNDVLSILAATLGAHALTERLRASDAAVVMKSGRTFPKIRAAARDAGVADRAIYVERASTEAERIAPLEAVDGTVPYMSLVLVPSAGPVSSPATRRGTHDRPAARVPGGSATRAPGRGHASVGLVSVVGLGPGGPQWRTTEAEAALCTADALVGYGTYLDRVPVRPGQLRLASENRVELDRARQALQLAREGRRVALVSSGDPGIFAMASAVFEALETSGTPFAAVAVDVVPGMSAMQAAAARAGAPLGHDFAVISLSDQLKPWTIIEQRLRAAVSADLAIAIYNPASRTRTLQLERALSVLRTGRAPRTPVVVARAVGAPEEHVTVTTLAGVRPEQVDMRTLLIVGSSTTRVIRRDGHPTRVYTPRSYPA